MTFARDWTSTMQEETQLKQSLDIFKSKKVTLV
jgi:hypothetical protein